MCLIEETKFANDPKAKITFYCITGQKSKAGCVNLIRYLFIQSKSCSKNKCQIQQVQIKGEEIEILIGGLSIEEGGGKH